MAQAQKKKDMQTNGMNKIENSEISSTCDSQPTATRVTLNKRTKNIPWRKGSLFNK
jgi:hypothetical protein